MKKLKKIALWDRILVKLDPEESVSAGGIVLLDPDARKQLGKETGVVVSIGPDAWKDTNTLGMVEVGDRVLFKRYAGISANLEFDEKGEQYRVMSENDIALVIKEDE